MLFGIEGLPGTLRNNDSILVVIDRDTKLLHLIPTSEEASSLKTADLFLREVVKHHGISNPYLSSARCCGSGTCLGSVLIVMYVIGIHIHDKGIQ